MKIEDVEHVMNQKKVEPTVVRDVVAELERLLEEAKAEREARAAKSKNQFVVIVYDEAGELAGKEILASVVQIPEEDDVATTLDRIYKSAYDFNAGSRKGKKNPLKKVAETLEVCSRKFFKENGVMVKTQEPVCVIFTDNQIPTQE